MKITTSRILLALPILLFAFSCEQAAEKDSDNKEVYTITNPTSTDFTDAGFQLATSDSISIYDEQKNSWLPVQYDDLDGDGKTDECFWLADVGADSSKSFRLGTAEKAVSTEKRVQVVFKTQDMPFSVEKASEVVTDYVSHQSLTVPADLVPQNKWVMFEGPVWENELVGYRFYLDSRQRNDIYGKKVPDLVMDTVGWDYHDIMDWGSDILKVGESLGLASPALWWNGKSYHLGESAKKEVQVVANGPLRSIIRINFTDLEIDSFKLNLTCEMKMQAGHHWTEVSLQSETPLPEGMKFATGIVKHLEAIQSAQAEAVSYIYNWGAQSYHEQGLGMAILAKKESQPRLQTTELDHLMILDGNNQEATYRFIAVWDQGHENIRSAAAFAQLLEQESLLWSADLSLNKKVQ